MGQQSAVFEPQNMDETALPIGGRASLRSTNSSHGRPASVTTATRSFSLGLVC